MKKIQVIFGQIRPYPTTMIIVKVKVYIYKEVRWKTMIFGHFDSEILRKKFSVIYCQIWSYPTTIINVNVAVYIERNLLENNDFKTF